MQDLQTAKDEKAEQSQAFQCTTAGLTQLKPKRREKGVRVERRTREERGHASPQRLFIKMAGSSPNCLGLYVTDELAAAAATSDSSYEVVALMRSWCLSCS